jgi:acetylornithine deacetylase
MHDGAFLNARGIAAICYGPGDIRVAHSPNESLRVDELVLAAKTYAALAIEWCGASPVTGG